MPRRTLSFVQQGIIAQWEFAKHLMMGSRGKIEVAAPLTDDERRDFEIHVRGLFGFGLAFQVKSSMVLAHVAKAYYLEVSFPVRVSRVVSNARFWYFFGYLDPKLMRFVDPVFVVPSAEVHAHAAPNRKGDYMHFNFFASMAPTTHDRWRPYRVEAVELGKHVLEIMNDLKKAPRLALPKKAELSSIPDALWVRAR